MEDLSDYSSYLLIKKYLAQNDKGSAQAKEIEKLLIEDLNLSKGTDFSSSTMQEKLNEIYKDEKQKIEKFIKISAWIFIVITGSQVLGAIYNGIIQVIGFKNIFPIKNFFIGELNPLFEYYIQHPILFYFLSLFIIMVMFISSIGVLNKSNLARKFGVALLVYKILGNLLEPLLVKYVYPSAQNLAISVPKYFADSMYQTSIMMSLIGSIVFIIIYGWLLYKYTSQDIVSEFN